MWQSSFASGPQMGRCTAAKGTPSTQGALADFREGCGIVGGSQKPLEAFGRPCNAFGRYSKVVGAPSKQETLRRSFRPPLRIPWKVFRFFLEGFRIWERVERGAKLRRVEKRGSARALANSSDKVACSMHDRRLSTQSMQMAAAGEISRELEASACFALSLACPLQRAPTSLHCCLQAGVLFCGLVAEDIRCMADSAAVCLVSRWLSTTCF